MIEGEKRIYDNNNNNNKIGDVVERGTHDELYQLGKVYRNLVDLKEDLG